MVGFVAQMAGGIVGMLAFGTLFGGYCGKLPHWAFCRRASSVWRWRWSSLVSASLSAVPPFTEAMLVYGFAAVIAAIVFYFRASREQRA